MTKNELVALLKIKSKASFEHAKELDNKDLLTSFGNGYDSGYRQAIQSVLDLLDSLE